MAALIPNEKCDKCLDKINFLPWTNTAGNHPGVVTPSKTDGGHYAGIFSLLKNAAKCTNAAGVL